jgi:hypothetical protein
MGGRRKLYLVMSLIANVGILAIFKYYPFIAENLEALFAWMGHPYDLPPLDDFYTGAARGISFILRPFGIQWDSPPVHLLLPIGLSFHTFQAMSYTIEVYRGHQAAERHFGIYAVRCSIQLVAGPIERPQNLLHQFHESHPLTTTASSRDYNHALGLSRRWSSPTVSSSPGRPRFPASIKACNARGDVLFRLPDFLRLLRLFRHRHRGRVMGLTRCSTSAALITPRRSSTSYAGTFRFPPGSGLRVRPARGNAARWQWYRNTMIVRAQRLWVMAPPDLRRLGPHARTCCRVFLATASYYGDLGEPRNSSRRRLAA